MSFFAPLLLATLAHAGTVDLDGTSWSALSTVSSEPALAEGAVVVSRTLRLTPLEDGTRVEASWVIQQWDETLRHYTLGPASMHVTSVQHDRPVRSGSPPPGPVISLKGVGLHRVQLVGVVPSDEVLSLLAANTGTVDVVGSALRVHVSGQEALAVNGVAWTGAQVLSLEEPIGVGRTRQDLAMGQVGLGLTVDEGAVTGHASVSVVIRSGSRERLRLRVSGLGADVVLTGDNVRDWRQTGDVIEVDLVSAVTDRVDVDIRWSLGATDTVAVPRIEPLDVFRTESSLQIASPDDLDVLPELPGWHAVARSAIPEWARALTDEAPGLSYTASGARGGSLTLLSFEPIPGPPVIVDVADWRLATSDEGRSLLRGLLDVRNERASHLRVDPPEGLTLIGVQVGGAPALPIADGDAWLIPLSRSVETVDGLLSFPVEVSLLGETSDWLSREQRDIPLPIVDAPVQVARVTLVLPPGYTDKASDGSLRVESFSDGQGISYGFAFGDVGVAVADATYRDAVDDWLSNDFAGAQEGLDALRSMGAVSGNMVRLQSNLDVVFGNADDVDERTVRRVKSQARARGVDQERAWTEVQHLAEEAEQRGDYSGSSAYYQAAVDIGDNLSLLEFDDVELSSGNAELREELDKVTTRRQELKLVAEQAGRWGAIVESDGLPWEVSGEELPWDVEDTPWMLEEGEVLSGGMVEGVISGAAFGVAGVSIASPAPPPPPMDSPNAVVGRDSSRRTGRGPFRMGRKALPEPEVHASALSLDIPVAGEVLFFQRLLLPEDEPFFVTIDAKNTHPRRSR